MPNAPTSSATQLATQVSEITVAREHSTPPLKYEGIFAIEHVTIHDPFQNVDVPFESGTAGKLASIEGWEQSDLPTSRPPTVIKRPIPRLEGMNIQDPVITLSTRKLLRSLGAIVISRALQIGFPLRKIKLDIFYDPEENERKALLHLTCNASITQTLAFWDSLDIDLNKWFNSLSDHDQKTFNSSLGLRFHWR